MKSRKTLAITGFKLEKRKDKTTGQLITENVPILIDFEFDGQRAIYPIGYRIDIDKWNNDEQIVKRNNINKQGVTAGTINKRIALIKEQLPNIYKNAIDLNLSVNKKYIWKELTEIIEKLESFEEEQTPVTERPKNLIEYVQEFIDSEGTAKDWSESTIKKIKTLKTHLSAYNKDLHFNDITSELLQSYINYQRTVLKLNNTTNLKYMKLFKWFLNWGVKKGYNTNFTFKNFEFKFKGTSTGDYQNNIVFLSWNELQHFNNFDFLSNTKLAQIRDVYCFCCFTSLRYSDIANLKKNDFKQDAEGNLYIEIMTVKTDDKLTIQLNKYAVAIWNKYMNIDLRDNRAFPVISNQKYNEYLKEAARLAGFDSKESITEFRGNKRIDTTFEKWELLTTHTARKTFIINALYLGIQPDIIRAWTGHKDHRTLEAYIKITDKQKAVSMNKFNEA
ncbi:MAG: phage integrase SAM-like domain-containing protein [Bacteroidales bacterium]|nr:phage integrase SAM-like domain-containing protein [Bacteroidales bacterium]